MNVLYQGLQWTFKAILCCKRVYQKVVSSEPKMHEVTPMKDLPWLWIGAELESGSILTVTEIVNKYVASGDVVTADYLYNVTLVPSVKRWLYLDTKTLNEQEIPTDGIVIQYDPSE